MSRDTGLPCAHGARKIPTRTSEQAAISLWSAALPPKSDAQRRLIGARSRTDQRAFTSAFADELDDPAARAPCVELLHIGLGAAGEHNGAVLSPRFEFGAERDRDTGCGQRVGQHQPLNEVHILVEFRITLDERHLLAERAEPPGDLRADGIGADDGDAAYNQLGITENLEAAE